MLEEQSKIIGILTLVTVDHKVFYDPIFKLEDFHVQ